MIDWVVFTYWSLGCVVFGGVLAWTRGRESNWFSYTAQSLVIGALWLPILAAVGAFLLFCAIATPFARAYTARKKRERMEAAKAVL